MAERLRVVRERKAEKRMRLEEKEKEEKRLKLEKEEEGVFVDALASFEHLARSLSRDVKVVGREVEVFRKDKGWCKGVVRKLVVEFEDGDCMSTARGSSSARPRSRKLFTDGVVLFPGRSPCITAEEASPSSGGG